MNRGGPTVNLEDRIPIILNDRCCSLCGTEIIKIETENMSLVMRPTSDFPYPHTCRTSKEEACSEA